MSPGVRTAWLGLGGNIGDVKTAMADALQLLNAADEIKIQTVSPVYKTPPWGVEDQPWFLNCCAAVNTSLSPEELLEHCQDAERAGKRERVKRWGPRTIDIDILAMEGVDQVEQRLTIPHPRLLERAFVLIPLADIAPEMNMQGKPVSQWANSVDQGGIENVEFPDNWWKNQN